MRPLPLQCSPLSAAAAWSSSRKNLHQEGLGWGQGRKGLAAPKGWIQRRLHAATGALGYKATSPPSLCFPFSRSEQLQRLSLLFAPSEPLMLDWSSRGFGARTRIGSLHSSHTIRPSGPEPKEAARPDRDRTRPPSWGSRLPRKLPAPGEEEDGEGEEGEAGCCLGCCAGGGPRSKNWSTTSA